MNQCDHEMISFLQAYVRINTAMPTPDYNAVHTLWEERASQDDLKSMRVPLASGYHANLITVHGSNASLPALILNHHMDVVPASNPELWIADPFSATIHEGRIIGRGVQDTKALGVIHYYAIRSLITAGYVPARTIHLVAIPDEECGGFKGTKEFLHTPLYTSLRIGFVLDEAPASGSAEAIMIKINERRPLQIRITAHGTMGHGSRLRCDNAIHTLISALARLVAQHSTQQSITGHSDGELLSCNITSLHAGVTDGTHIALNVIPAHATATVDIRVPPQMHLSKVYDILQEMCQQATQLSYSIEAVAHEQIPMQHTSTFLVECASAVLKKYGFDAIPSISEGASDMRFYQQQGIEAIGFAPFTSIDNAHGVNESLSIEEIVRAHRMITDLIMFICTAKDDKL
jgi:aminoacylase